jgi:hypothetical protein
MIGAVVEIACDESGFSGTNLLHSATPVITHASVDLCAGEAIGLITALQSGFRFSPHEFKSGKFLRGPGAGETLEWFLAALNGRARVHLVDKEFFVVTRIVDLLLAEPSYAAGTRLTQDHRPAALALYRARRSAGSDWGVFLAAFVDLGSSGVIRIAGPWSGSFRPGMRWHETGSAHRPRLSSTGSARPTCEPC